VRIGAVDLAEHLGALLGADDVVELGGGHQSRVCKVGLPGGSVAVAKVLDAIVTDRVELEARLRVTSALADIDSRVCRPVVVGQHPVIDTVVDGRDRYVVCFEYAPGQPPDPSNRADAERMGAALAHLHASLRRVPEAPLPLVAALRTAPPEPAASGGAVQLLHGDFNADNLRATNDGLRVFDLDDCGYGPPAFDVANALYLVLFDATVDRTPAKYETFRRSFVPAYLAACDPPVPVDDLDRFIDLRVAALRAWTEDLDHAPTGIRTASAEWLETLRSFVATYRRTA
jgi:Ser/Thr protein kinase RdoA (MazF antagonist)